MYVMRGTTVAPVEAGSHVGCQRQLLGTVEAADRDCAADALGKLATKTNKNQQKRRLF